MKCVPLGISPINIIQSKTLRVTLDSLLHGCPEGDEIVDSLVGFLQTVVLDILEFLDGRLNILLAEQIHATLEVDSVNRLQLISQNIFQQHIGHPLLPFKECFARSQVFIAKPDQQLQSRNLGQMFFVYLKITHIIPSLSSTNSVSRWAAQIRNCVP